ncbi:efflux RND transporter periplasmic adaptor subunit [Pseudoalteromonas piscicida]|uniref:efflux RND transporter periplasmic adaptor subunit n=1 Tax=Pseudoalteromonas piscicida TaxID=43662 RepID=UPI0030B6DB10
MDKKIESHIGRRRIITIVLVGLSIFVTIAYLIGELYGEPKVSLESVEISEVTKGKFVDKVNARGVVEPHYSYILDASEGGRVEKILVEEGAYVKKGQKLIELSNTGLQLNVMSREADVSEQLNFVRNTRIEMERRVLELENNLLDSSYNIATLEARLERLVALQDKNFVAIEEMQNLQRERDYQKAKYQLAKREIDTEKLLRDVQLKQLEEAVENLEANLKIAREVVEKLTITAAVDGRLTVLNARVGESKSKGDNLGQIDDESSLKVVAKVDEYYLPKLRVDTRGQLNHQGKSYDIYVTRIYPQVVGGQFRFDLAFKDQKPENLTLGQNFSISLSLSEVPNAVMVKKGDFYQESGGNWIFVFDPESSLVTKRPITLGAQSGSYLLVERGLRSGEKVITSSYESFAQLESFKLQ